MTQEEAYKQIDLYYRANRQALVKRFNRYVNSQARAEDIIQEAFTRLLNYWQKIPSNPEDFEKYFRTILNNCAKDNNKIERTKGMQDYNEEVEEIPERTRAIPQIIYGEITRLINSKPDNIKNILTLYLIDGYTSKEIAQQVKETAGTIRNAVWEFRKQVRETYRWSL